ncbi:MAG TPA: iron-sulfur cluster assembly accessory protein [Sphingomicrobium sp.]|nr:iron-sulfur cluster assembly accessory protein [Sphingomicrobium sp.]
MTQPDISLTQNAARRVAAIAARKNAPPVLRLAVDGGGCAGFTYSFELAEAPAPEDAVAETDGVKLVVDPASLELVRGSAVDFVEDLGGAAFRVTNPNAQSGCGCGSSFSV